MEFVEGETLESLLKRSGRLEVTLALEITSQVAAGLDAIYDHKLVHRDIKATNIMVRFKEEGRVIAKIIDLGLARELGKVPNEGSRRGPLPGHRLLPVRSSLRGSAWISVQTSIRWA